MNEKGDFTLCKHPFIDLNTSVFYILYTALQFFL